MGYSGRASGEDRGFGRRVLPWNPFQKRGVEVVALIVATATAGHLLFASTLPVAFLVFPFVLWAGLRLGVPSAATVNVLLMLVAGWASVESQVPFSQLEPVQNLTVLHTFNASIGITSLVLAAVTAERKQAAEELWASRVRLVEAADAEPRRVERNLHDGAQ